ncbi:MAG: S9 family peptidase, partial [Flavobacteriaceae bacterium]
MRTTLVSIFLLLAMTLTAQTNMTPERLIELGRVSAMGISTDNNYIIYSVKTYNVAANKGEKEYFKIPVNGGSAIKIAEAKDYLLDDNISADGQYKLSSKEVKLLNVTGSDLYPDLKESQALIYDNLNYRHWDTWEDGKFDHVFLQKLTAIGFDEGIDLLKGEKYESPTKPFGGSEDYIWNPNGKEIVYVCKKKFGKEYAESTNTDLFLYNIADKT